MPASAPVTPIARDNANTALLFFAEDGSVGGYFRDADNVEYRVKGSMNDRRLEADILHDDTPIGTLVLAKRSVTSKIVADGHVNVHGTTLGVCASSARLQDGTYGLTVFPDKMPARVTCPWVTNPGTAEVPDRETPPVDAYDDDIPF